MYAALERNPKLITVCRTLVTDYGQIDYPQDWNWGDASAWWSHIKHHLPSDCDYYEVINESTVPPQGYGHWAQWHIEMAQLVERDTSGALLAFSFAAGTPELSQWAELLPYIQWAASNPTADGKYHGIAFHAAPNTTFSRNDMPWLNDPFLTVDRFFIKVVDEYKLHDSPITIGVTEWGLSGGYSGNWIASYTCEEAADAYQTTLQHVREIGWQGLVILNWWTINTGGSIWIDDSEYLGEMVQ